MTVYYRWHPLFGQTLNVYKRRRGRTGERTVCELGDGRTIAIPAWMLHPDCAQMLLGPPQISLEALAELRRLLSDLRNSTCDKGSLTPTPKERVDEANAQATQAHHGTVHSVADEHAHKHGGASREAEGTKARADRPADQRGVSRRGKSQSHNRRRK